MSKQSFWENHIRAWQASDQTQRAYCDAQAISLPSFSYWRHKLKVRAAPETKGMMPISVATSDASVTTRVLPRFHGRFENG